MANKYYEQHRERSPLADVGMTVAFSVTVVTLLKLVMYGLTYVSIFWLLIALLYILSTTLSLPNSSTRKALTICFLLVSTVGLYASFFYDKPVLPKTESNIKGTIDDLKLNENNNSDVIIETPKPVVVETDNIVQEDESTFEVTEANDTQDNYDISTSPTDEDVELIDINDVNNEENKQVDVNPAESKEMKTLEQNDELDADFK